jgi:transposase
MVQGYKTSNSTGTSRRTTGNGYTILKGSVLFSYSGKKGEYGTLSYKNDDRHPYDKRNKDTATKLNLPELEKSDRETGGIMLNVTGMNRFYYLRNFHDMRCKYERVLSIIHQQLNREPQEDEVFIVLSKDRRKVRLFSYDRRSFSLYEKRFCEGYRFMQLYRQGDETIYSIQWKDVVVLLQNPVINQLNIR